MLNSTNPKLSVLIKYSIVFLKFRWVTPKTWSIDTKGNVDKTEKFHTKYSRFFLNFDLSFLIFFFEAQKPETVAQNYNP